MYERYGCIRLGYFETVRTIPVTNAVYPAKVEDFRERVRRKIASDQKNFIYFPVPNHSNQAIEVTQIRKIQRLYGPNVDVSDERKRRIARQCLQNLRSVFPQEENDGTSPVSIT